MPSRPLPHSHRIAPSLPYTNLQPSPANTCAVVSDRSPRANRSVHPEPVPLPPALQPRIVRYRLAASPAPAASHNRLFPLQPPLCVCPASIPPASHACPTASAATSRAIARPFSRRQSPNPSAVRAPALHPSVHQLATSANCTTARALPPCIMQTHHCTSLSKLLLGRPLVAQCPPDRGTRYLQL